MKDKLEVGMYVRTPKGIAKITSMYSEPNQYIVYTDKDICFEYYLNNKGEWVTDYIKGKPSFNIIELIEVGDIINKKEVMKIIHFEGDTFYRIELFGGKAIMNSKDIKSIVTKEQFESMSYHI